MSTGSRYLCQLADAGAQFFGHRLRFLHVQCSQEADISASLLMLVHSFLDIVLLVHIFWLSSSPSPRCCWSPVTVYFCQLADAGAQFLVIVFAFSSLLVELCYSAVWLVQALLGPYSVPPDHDVSPEVGVLGHVVHLFGYLVVHMLAA